HVGRTQVYKHGFIFSCFALQNKPVIQALYFLRENMDSYLSQIVNVVLAVIVTFALNTGLSYLVSDNGSVTIGRPLDIQETSY
ncbi:hypothetical protein, partial [Pseudoalteromonas sp. S558]|uniref:hypothetical protein n=1 Tax=Pseudoalteromonas sp. S558 TaxID=2066515 RepID=UPI001BB19337